MILCKDCNHVREYPDGYECHHPGNTDMSFITGAKHTKQSISVFRIERCGQDAAKFFEHKRGD